MKPISLLFLILSVALSAAAFEFSGEWKAEANGRALPKKWDGAELKTSAEFPGGVLIYKEQPRYLFRPDRRAFDSRELVMEVKAENTTSPLKAWIFVKDKEGAWFQSAKEFSLKPDEWTRLSVRLDIPGKELLPMGHNAVWNGYYASKIFSAGLSIYSEEMQKAEFSVRNPMFEGKREARSLAVMDWEMPSAAAEYDLVRSTFQLTREYFNPFNPDEIAVDFEVIAPSSGGVVKRYPAFYSQDCRRDLHFTRELVVLQGCPFWEFRYVPKEKGKHKIRLRIMDATVDPVVAFTLYTDWREMDVTPSNAPGFIRVSKRNPHYFEYERGGFFYPIGINIHSNTDQRSENSFGFGHLPDRGNVDYEEYIRSCSQAGINLMEVWMASWTYAIEWSSSRSGFYGVGNYNLVNAWKLDYLLNYAKQYNMMINLVLDNHGKIADVCDPEWYDSPYNAKGIFAVANSAFLQNADEFWCDPKAIDFARKRNRYIAARWGAYPNIFAMELWSEVDLVSNSHKRRDDKSMIKWHQMTANDIKRDTQGEYLVATHVCGDIGNVMGWKALTIEPKELDHVCGDAYRSAQIPIVNQMQKHQAHIQNIAKPALITEYGGTAGGSAFSLLTGDIHGGVWAALFTRHAGTPLLWWHDFIHIRNQYAHYKGFSEFIKGLDLRNGRITYGVLVVEGTLPKLPPQPVLNKTKKLFHSLKQIAVVPEKGLSGLFLNQNGTFVCGWIYNVEQLYHYLNDQNDVPVARSVHARMNTKLEPGIYLLQFFDTLTNRLLTSRLLSLKQTNQLTLDCPDIRLDASFKLTRIGGAR